VIFHSIARRTTTRSRLHHDGHGGRQERTGVSFPQYLSRKSDTIFGQGTILEPSMPHIGREVAFVAQAATLVYINARPSQIAEMITHDFRNTLKPSDAEDFQSRTLRATIRQVILENKATIIDEPSVTETPCHICGVEVSIAWYLNPFFHEGHKIGNHMSNEDLRICGQCYEEYKRRQTIRIPSKSRWYFDKRNHINFYSRSGST
jgi:hypothetical protein